MFRRFKRHLLHLILKLEFLEYRGLHLIFFFKFKTWLFFKRWLLALTNKVEKYELESDLWSPLTSSRIWNQTIFLLCQQYSVWMSSTADQTSKNRSEISHCKPSIEFSLSWESMHFPHLASEDYDLFDPLNHVWEGVRKSVGRGSAFKEALTLLFKHIWQERKGRALSVGQSARSKEMKVRYLGFDSVSKTQTYALAVTFFGYLSGLCFAASKKSPKSKMTIVARL